MPRAAFFDGLWTLSAFGLLLLAALAVPTWDRIAGPWRFRLAATATAGGTVVASGLRHDETHDAVRGRRDPRWTPEVVYAFEANGRPHRGTRLGFGPLAFTRRADAEAVRQRYPVGRRVTVAYRTAEPSDAVLAPISTGALWLAMPLLALGCLAGIVVGRAGRRARR